MDGVDKNACSSSHSETNPLSGGRPASARVPDQGHGGDPGHAANQATEFAQAALVGGVKYGTGGKKEQTLEQCMIECMQQRRGQRQRRQ